MIVSALYKTRSDDVRLFRTYSDEGKQIIQNETGNIYAEAIDVENAPYTYSEYDLPTDDPEDTAPEVGDGDETAIMTRAELTSEVNELKEAMNLILSGVTE